MSKCPKFDEQMSQKSDDRYMFDEQVYYNPGNLCNSWMWRNMYQPNKRKTKQQQPYSFSHIFDSSLLKIHTNQY